MTTVLSDTFSCDVTERENRAAAAHEVMSAIIEKTALRMNENLVMVDKPIMEYRQRSVKTQLESWALCNF